MKFKNLLLILVCLITSSYLGIKEIRVLTTQFIDQIGSPNQSFDEGLLGSNPFAFSKDGMKLILIGNIGNIEDNPEDNLLEYDLSAPFDISNPIENHSYSINLLSGIKNISFSEDGYSLFLNSTTRKTLYQLPLTKAFDISTLNLNNPTNELELDEYETPYDGFTFSENGTILTLVNSTKALQYSLTTGFDLSTASLTPQEFDMPIIGNISTLTFSEDGTTVLLSGTHNDIYEYSLQTAYDLSVSSRTLAGSIQLFENSAENLIIQIQLIGDQVLFIRDNSNESLHRYFVDQAIDLDPPSFNLLDMKGETQTSNFTTTIELGDIYNQGEFNDIDDDSDTTSNITFLLADGTTEITEPFSGTKPLSGTYVAKYKVTDDSALLNATTIIETIEVVPTMKLIGEINSPDQTFTPSLTSIRSFAFSDDGMKLVLLDGSGDLYHYVLSSPYNTTNFTQSESFNLSLNARDIAFSTDGTLFFYLDDNNVMYSYELEAAYDISTLNLDTETPVSLATFTTENYRSFTFSEDGQILTFINNAKFLQLDLGASFDLEQIEEANEATENLVPSTIGNIDTFAFSKDGQRALITGNNNELYEYYLQIPYDLSDTSLVSINSTNLTDTNTTKDIQLVKDLLLFVLDEETGSLYRYLLDSTLDVTPPVFSITATNQPYDDDFTTTLNVGDTYIQGSFSNFFEPPISEGLSKTFFKVDGITQLSSLHNTQPEPGVYFVRYTFIDNSPIKNRSTIQETVTVKPTIQLLDLILTLGEPTNFNHNRKIISVLFSEDGLKMTGLRGGGGLDQYDLTTPYDISTANNLNQTIGNLSANRIAFSNTGDFLFYTSNDKYFYRLALTNPYDLSSLETASLSSLNLTGFDGVITDNYLAFSFSGDGKQLVFVNKGHALQFSLTEAFNLSTATLAVPEFEMPFDEDIQAMTFSKDGKRVLFTGIENDLYEYYLKTPYDLSINSRVLATNINLPESNNTRDIQLIENDKRLLVVDRVAKTFYKYQLKETLNVSPKVFLQGAYNADSNLMNDNLRSECILVNQTTSPYQDGLIADASVFDVTGPDAIVDWVYVELKESLNSNSPILGATSALLQKDGDVVAIDGVSPLSFSANSGDYYMTISHRNHLNIITASTSTFSSQETNFIDFTTNVNLVKGSENGLKELESGVFGMYAGDVNKNKVIETTDVVDINNNNSAVPSYYLQDVNLDGKVDDTDKNMVKVTVGKAVQM